MYCPVHFSIGQCSYKNLYKIYITYEFSGTVSTYISCDSITGVYEYVGYLCATSLEKIIRLDYYKVKEESK